MNKVTIYPDKIRLSIDKSILIQALTAISYGQLLNLKNDGEHPIDFSYEVKISPLSQRGTKIVIGHNKIEYNLTLIQAVTKGFYYSKLLEENRLTKEQKNSSHIRRLITLRFLLPNIIESILNGAQDRSLTVKALYPMARI